MMKKSMPRFSASFRKVRITWPCAPIDGSAPRRMRPSDGQPNSVMTTGLVGKAFLTYW